MTREDALEILRKHQEWRRYNGPIGEGSQMQDPIEIGKAIDVAIEVLSKPPFPTIKGWVARYANGDLEFGVKKPQYYEYEGQTYITDPCDTIPLDKTLFPKLRWGDEPIEVELQINARKEE